MATTMTGVVVQITARHEKLSMQRLFFMSFHVRSPEAVVAETTSRARNKCFSTSLTSRLPDTPNRICSPPYLRLGSRVCQVTISPFRAQCYRAHCCNPLPGIAHRFKTALRAEPEELDLGILEHPSPKDTSMPRPHMNTAEAPIAAPAALAQQPKDREKYPAAWGALSDKAHAAARPWSREWLEILLLAGQTL